MTPAKSRKSTASGVAPSKAGSKPRSKSRSSRKLSWLLLVYKVPSEPSRVRVGVWRELKRLGALYLQQAVAIFPDQPAVHDGLAQVRARITEVGGTYHFFELAQVATDHEANLVRGFRDLAGKEYAEIVEECETKFLKEIEFERFRGNFTFEEAEEIRQDLEKIRRWFDRVVGRDWFAAEGRAEVERWLERCETELELFEGDVYEKTGGADPSAG
jgi:hypothetical protein